MTRFEKLYQLLEQKIVFLDGAMGTMIQKHQLSEQDYRGERFKDWDKDLKGNNDLLCLTQPQIIEDIHYAYLKAGAQIIETNTFNAQAISLEDYQMQSLATEINVAAVVCAQKAVERFKLKNPSQDDLFIAGAIGPMNKTLSLSPDVNRPGYRAVTFDEVSAAYLEQITALIEAGVDILLIETIFDTLNAKAAIYAVASYYEAHPDQEKLPLMISGTITDASGRTLSGQNLEAFLISVLHAEPISIGLNCALGAEDMKPYLQELSQKCPCFVSAYPNAGLPNALGQYDETPEITASITRQFAENGWVNILGGCCGTTPEHIEAMKNCIAEITPRPLPQFS